jgi:tRNA pseudouridine55 synthase
MKHGILLLDKPQGLSSNAAMQRVRWILGKPKAGHTGSLDPLATGMLPICIGEATKVAGFLLDGDKSYEFTARFGGRSSTGDLEGEIVEQAPVPTDLEAALRVVMPRFLGPIEQIPPMYSALKRDGQPLYKLARLGLEVERAARSLTIHELVLRRVEGNEALFFVRCSKGTYVRTLAEDIARTAGSAAHLSLLRRTAVAPFANEAMISLDELAAAPERARLLPPDSALAHLPAVILGADAAQRLGMGQRVLLPSALPPGQARIYAEDGRFLGIGECEDDAGLKPVRLFNDLGVNRLETQRVRE